MLRSVTTRLGVGGLGAKSRSLTMRTATAPGPRTYLRADIRSLSSTSYCPADAVVPTRRPPAKEHAVISAFDLFSIGVGPSSSHTVGPMRAAKIFIVDLEELGLLEKVETLKVTLYGSLAATGKGHATPEALMMGFQGGDPETIDTHTIGSRYKSILENKVLILNGTKKIKYDMDKDMVWRFDQVLKTHPNGMRFSAFGPEGELLATNEYFSVGGGFVVNEKTKVDENLYYMGINKRDVEPARLSQSSQTSTSNHPAGSIEGPVPIISSQPPNLFHSSESLLALTQKHNKTIAQIVYDNERHYLTPTQIRENIQKIWGVMDECIRTGVSTTETVLPGRMQVARRAPNLYKRLMRGFYPGLAQPPFGSIGGPSMSPENQRFMTGPASDQVLGSPSSPNSNTVLKARTPRVIGSFDHDVPPMPSRKTIFPGIDFLSCYAIAVNEVNAAGGRIVTSPTNGASGVIPAVLKYIVEFISEDPETDIMTFLLTAAAIGMLFKRGATISAAEGGCMAEVGVACAMAAAGFAATMGASPRIITQAAEIGIEHSLGLTCDPLDGLVQVPCIRESGPNQTYVRDFQGSRSRGLVCSLDIPHSVPVSSTNVRQGRSMDEEYECSISRLDDDLLYDLMVLAAERETREEDRANKKRVTQPLIQASALHFPEIAAQVDRRWRSVAVSSPAIWARLRLGGRYSPARTQLWLDRSGQALLEVLWQIGSTLSFRYLQDHQSLVLPHLCRISRLIINVCGYRRSDRFLENILIAISHSRTLHTLELYNVYETGLNYQLDASTIPFPFLRTLKTSRSGLLWKAVRNLTRVKLWTVNRAFGDVLYEELEDLLASSTGLEELSLQHLPVRILPSMNAMDLPIFHFLRDLEVVCEWDFCSLLLRSLRAPNLRSLSFGLIGPQGSLSTPSLLQFAASLKRLMIAPINEHQEAVQVLLKSRPKKLTVLGMEGWSAAKAPYPVEIVEAAMHCRALTHLSFKHILVEANVIEDLVRRRLEKNMPFRSIWLPKDPLDNELGENLAGSWSESE
ncbi:hypothetical protein FRB98_006091 [Tulasnella sp. 332]|nr:hypothetical protein FRB98_006091 [Tulasnella sp. 332]